jgi:uncharacterized protein
MAVRALRVPIGELRRRLGQRRRVEISHDPGPLAVGTSHTVGEPVTGELTIESIQNGVSVSGELRVAWEGECRRCLQEVRGTSTIDLHEIYQLHPPPDSDIYELWSEDQVDLAPMVRESVLLALPLGPLCRPDCQGPDPDRFPAAVEADDAHPGDLGPPSTPDPRWAALGEVRFDEP